MALVLNGSGAVTGLASINTTVDSTEIGYLDGVSSAVQTQINANLPGMQLVTAQSFTAVSSVSVNNCFTSTYENYRVVMTATATSGGGINMRMRAGGTDNSSATSYPYQVIFAVGTSVSAGSGNSTLFEIGQIRTNLGSFVFEVSGPNLPNRTLVTQTGSDGAGQISWYSGVHTVASAFDGFTLSVPSGNMTGSLRVYGYRNSL